MKFGVISLGCDKNRVDSERMIFSLLSAGYVSAEKFDDADIILINTCAFIDKAKEETIDAVLEAAEYRKKNLKLLIAAGCFATRYGATADLPEVDIFLPVDEEKYIVEKIAKFFGKKNLANRENGVIRISRGKIFDRVLTTPPHYAYLKIADGCRNRCSFCAIPNIRGEYLSVPMDDLLFEADSLLEAGVKELILVAQDTTNYGRDIYGAPALPVLLKKLSAAGFWKIRILYACPDSIDDELLETVIASDNVAKYIDVPLQHINADVLRRMNRRDPDKILPLIEKIRSASPDITIRSTFICGFPGETEEAHKELVEFLESGVDYAGFFAFSEEEGTPIFGKGGRIPRPTIDRRIEECEIIQTRRTIEYQKKFLNKVLPVVYEGLDFEKQFGFGRSEFTAPEADPPIYFLADFPLEVGNIYDVFIEKTDFNLYGRALPPKGESHG